jgi:hypothetical protein
MNILFVEKRNSLFIKTKIEIGLRCQGIPRNLCKLRVSQQLCFQIKIERR